MLLVQWLYNNTGILQQYYGLVFDYLHQIIQQLFLIHNLVILSIDRLGPGLWGILCFFVFCRNEWSADQALGLASQSAPAMTARCACYKVFLA